MPEPAAVEPAFVIEQQAAPAREVTEIGEVIDQTTLPLVATQPRVFTLTLELPITQQPLSQIKSVTIGHLFGKEAADGKVSNLTGDLGQLDEIVLRINGSYLGHGALMRWDDGWGLRITHLGQQVERAEEKE